MSDNSITTRSAQDIEDALYCDPIESAVLSALLRYPGEWKHVAGRLAPADFGRSVRQTIFRRMADGACSYASVEAKLRLHSEYEECGAELLSCFNDEAGANGIQGDWVPTLKEYALARRVKEQTELLATLPYNPHLDIRQGTLRIAKRLRTLAEATMPEESRFCFLTAAEIEDRPPMEWLIAKILPKVGTSFLIGEYGAGKSFLALYTALCINQGYAWHGHPVKHTGPIAYIAAEGVEGMTLRLRALRESKGLPKDALQNFYMLPGAPNLMRQDDLGALISAIEALPQPPALIVLDTLARCSTGSDENSQRDMGIFVDAMHTLRQRFNCQVTALHHKNKEGGIRGSTALPGGAETIIEVTQVKQDQEKRLKVACLKQKDGADLFEEVNFLLKPVVIDAAADLSTCIVVDAETAPSTPKLRSSVHLSLQALEDGMTATEWQRAAEKAGVASQTFWKVRTEVTDKQYVAKNGDHYMLTRDGKKLLSPLSGEQKESGESRANASRPPLSLLSGGVAPESRESGGVMPESENASGQSRKLVSYEPVEVMPMNRATDGNAARAIAPDLLKIKQMPGAKMRSIGLVKSPETPHYDSAWNGLHAREKMVRMAEALHWILLPYQGQQIGGSREIWESYQQQADIVSVLNVNRELRARFP